jgi:hypothetical protein
MTATQQEQVEQQVAKLLEQHATLREQIAKAKTDKAREKPLADIAQVATMLRLAGYALEEDTSEPVAPQQPKAKEEKRPDNAFEAGGLWFVPTSGLTSKKAQRVTKLVRILKEQSDPIEFAELCKRADERYPQDVQASVVALETLGMVAAFHEFRDGSEKAKLFVKWIEHDEEEQDAPAAA